MTTNYNVIVDVSGYGDVTTIQQAIDLAPNDESPYTIFIRQGQYEEKLHITRPNIHFIGQSAQQTIISFTSANGLLANDGKIWATYNSYVVNADADNITFQSLTIENSFDFLANQQKQDSDLSKITATQAVAFLVGQNGDHVQCRDCVLKSYQDTLYVSAGSSYFESVEIWGTVDYVFGGGTALCNQCQLVSRWRNDLQDDSPWGYVCAPSTMLDQPFGLVFYRCQLTKESPKVPERSYKLGRPWHPTTTFEDGSYAHPLAIGHCAFIECEINNHIGGWDKMHGKDKDGSTKYFYPQDSRFHTYNNTHDQNITHVNHGLYEMDSEQRQQYTLANIFKGWTPTLLIHPID